MKKMLSLVALAAALMVSGVANAAAVNISFDQTSAGGPFSLTVSVEEGVLLSQIAILITGSTSGNTFTLAANGGPNAINISTNDSVIATNGEGGRTPQIQLNPPAFGDLLFTGNGPVVLGTLVAGNPGALGIGDGDAAFGYTALDTAGNPIADYSLAVNTVPEPASLVLLGLGLAGIASVRRLRNA